MKKKFEDVEGKTPSEIFIEDFFQYYIAFQKNFSKDNVCINRLWEWRGWIEKKDGVKWKECPLEGCDSTRAKLHKDNKANPLAKTYRCINAKPKRHEYSILSNTLFHNTRSPLWFWYLIIYSMKLLLFEHSRLSLNYLSA